MYQLNGDVEILFERLHPVIAQVTPGTNIIGEDFDGDGIRHRHELSFLLSR
jgi:hypothetical protein